jgi:RNA 2',3'-cyclic 3'-phosphodiesterase
MKRTFIAVPVEASENLLKILAKSKQMMKNEDFNWVDPRNLHITIKFLGDTVDDQMKPVREKFDRISSCYYKSTGKLSGLSYFDNKGVPSVLVSEMTGLPGLEMMYDEFNIELAKLGFLQDYRKFRSHLTLARIKSVKDIWAFKDLMRIYKDTFIQEVKMQKIVWYESILQPSGPVYKPLREIELKTGI